MALPGEATPGYADEVTSNPKRYVVVNKRSGSPVTAHHTPNEAAEAIVKAGAWTKWVVQRGNGDELSGEDLHRINAILYPALHKFDTET